MQIMLFCPFKPFEHHIYVVRILFKLFQILTVETATFLQRTMTLNLNIGRNF